MKREEATEIALSFAKAHGITGATIDFAHECGCNNNGFVQEILITEARQQQRIRVFKVYPPKEEVNDRLYRNCEGPPELVTTIELLPVADWTNTVWPFWFAEGLIWGYHLRYDWQAVLIYPFNPFDIVLGLASWLIHGLPRKFKNWSKYRQWICVCGNCIGGHAICRVMKRK